MATTVWTDGSSWPWGKSCKPALRKTLISRSSKMTPSTSTRRQSLPIPPRPCPPPALGRWTPVSPGAADSNPILHVRFFLPRWGQGQRRLLMRVFPTGNRSALFAIATLP